MLQILLQNGASPTHQDPLGRTALDYATEQGHEEVAAFLRHATEGRAA
jgi:hypothetical protein